MSEDRHITLAQAAKQFGISAATLRRALRGWTDPRSKKHNEPTLQGEERMQYNGLKVWYVLPEDVAAWKEQHYAGNYARPGNE